MNYYNDIDPAACAVLRELASRNVIPPGDVDSRSIKDVTPDDLAGYTQCHFFAGAGLWPFAFRLAGWPDSRRGWSGSCPCQGESLAGKRLGADDPRHLWPDFHRLIRACRPPVVVGEQVAAAAGTHWLDGVCADLAVENYAARAVDIPACAVDAPHQRNRLYWIAVEHAQGERRREGRSEHELWRGRDAAASTDVQLQPDANCGGRYWRPEVTERSAEQRTTTERIDGGLLTDTGRELRGCGPGIAHNRKIGSNSDGRNGSWWADAEWIVSPLDDKARRTKPGLPFLVDGLVGRADLWRLCGNSIVPILAAEVIAAFLETEGSLT